MYDLYFGNPGENIRVEVNESISVTDVVTAQLLTVRIKANVNEAITVSEAAQTQITGPITANVHETIGVVDVAHPAITPLVVRANEPITVTEAVTATLQTPGLSVNVFETIGVADAVSRHMVTHKRLTVFEAITIYDSYPTLRIPDELNLARAEFIAVRDVVTAQMRIGGGLAVRVHENISVAENPFYIGHPPTGTGGSSVGGGGTTGQMPDNSVTNIGPEPGVPPVPTMGEVVGPTTHIGEDYWVIGV